MCDWEKEPPTYSNMQAKVPQLRRRVYMVLRENRKSLVILPENATMVALQPKGKRRPFFMVDSVEYFIDVVKRIGPDQPVLSLVPREETHTNTSGEYDIRHEATAHVNTVLRYQPRGPYILGGFSSSGIVAYDIAQQLQARGHEVGLLVLFETPNPYFMGEHSPLLARLPRHRAELSRMRWSEIPGWTVGKLSRMLWLLRARRERTKKAIAMGVEGLNAARIGAARKYRPKPYTGRILLVKRHYGLHAQFLDPMYGWGGVVQGKVEICLIGAIEHGESFKSESDQELIARKLLSSISDSAEHLSIPSHSSDS